jgi:hypothetical protein
MSFLRLLVIVLVIAPLCLATTLYSGFESGTTEGWTLVAPFPPLTPTPGLGPTVMPTGGALDPHYIAIEDAANGFVYFQAPASWVGDFYGSRLSFFLRSQNPNTYHNSGYYGDAVVIITGGGPTLYYFNAPGANNWWTYNSIDLEPGPNWSLDLHNASLAPTADQVYATLSGITHIYILADWVPAYYGRPGGDYGHDITELDNVTLGAPEPASLALLGMGLIGLGILARRKSA